MKLTIDKDLLIGMLNTIEQNLFEGRLFEALKQIQELRKAVKSVGSDDGDD